MRNLRKRNALHCDSSANRAAAATAAPAAAERTITKRILLFNLFWVWKPFDFDFVWRICFLFLFLFIYFLLGFFFNGCCAPNLARPSCFCCCCCCCLMFVKFSFIVFYYVLCYYYVLCISWVCVCVHVFWSRLEQRHGKRKPSEVDVDVGVNDWQWNETGTTRCQQRRMRWRVFASLLNICLSLPRMRAKRCCFSALPMCVYVWVYVCARLPNINNGRTMKTTRKCEMLNST